MKAKGYAAHSPTSLLEPFTFERREVGPRDVHIEILYCGICHSDLHIAKNEWNNSHYPVVPGHEIIGKVIQVGKKVKKYKTGDHVAVGVMVGSCGKCTSCKEGLEQYCEPGFTLTYNSEEKETGTMTYGGYSDNIVVNEHFVFKIPKALDLKSAAPLLCAGITVYSPLRHWKIGKKDKVGVIGLGGLGHLAVKMAHALGAHVTMITTSPQKEKDARKLGAHEVLISTDKAQMEQHQNQFDFLINTIPRTHDINPYIELLKRDGVMVIVGALELIKSGIDGKPLILKRRSIAGSVVGGIAETQEMLHFCAKHSIAPNIEMIHIQDLNKAYERLLKNDVKYRFVIDMAGSDLNGTN